MPFSLVVLPRSRLAYWEPWSEWCMQPSRGRLRAMAILSASSASSAVILGPHRPAHHPARPCVHHDRQVEPALMGADVGDVGEPRLVGAIGAEVAPHRVVMEVLLRGALLAGGAPGAGARDAPPTVLAHDAGDALLGGGHARRLRPHECLRRAVYAHAGLVLAAYHPCELQIAQRMLAGGPAGPQVVAPPGDAERPAHGGHLVFPPDDRLRMRTWPPSQLLAREEGAGF